MTVPLINLLIDELTKQLGDRQFYTIHDLHAMGFFGSLQAARKALQLGHLPFVRISQRRCVIPKAAVLKFLRENLKHPEGP